ncbi:hypothetical protein F511_24494 [Dorcoceras hygrometricum]|uniref:Uncharacterized protein n=1 Tax=Dorcoceras hygrometricum TaxID=472368 RepID=A0A2Z7BTA9_9LAMI|nr:hypothetical protein F511_24494 [Dorcoceras hygrometricum]
MTGSPKLLSDVTPCKGAKIMFGDNSHEPVDCQRNLDAQPNNAPRDLMDPSIHHQISEIQNANTS